MKFHSQLHYTKLAYILVTAAPTPRQENQMRNDFSAGNSLMERRAQATRGGRWREWQLWPGPGKCGRPGITIRRRSRQESWFSVERTMRSGARHPLARHVLKSDIPGTPSWCSRCFTSSFTKYLFFYRVPLLLPSTSSFTGRDHVNNYRSCISIFTSFARVARQRSRSW